MIYLRSDKVQSRAFTLVELLVACTVTAIILGIMAAILNNTSIILQRNNARLEIVQGARQGSEAMARLLGQATLNTYWDYRDSAGRFRAPSDPAFIPVSYGRQSELHFLVAQSGKMGIPGTEGTGQAVFFQAPAVKASTTNAQGYENNVGLLNACGFYVEYNSDAQWLPAHLGADQARSRFRLMQWVQDTTDLNVDLAAQSGAVYNWIKTAKDNVIPLSDNVIAMVVWARDNGAVIFLDSYHYDSREGTNDTPQSPMANQLPPVLQIALVAIDEASAQRLGDTQREVIGNCLAGLFDSKPVTKFATDLETLQERLQAKSIAHRVFVSTLPLREARWSAK